MTYTTTTTTTPTHTLDETAQEIVKRVCKTFSIKDPLMLFIKCRERQIVQARWSCWMLLHEQGYGASRIGRLFHHDHTSVLNCLSKFNEDLNKMPQFKKAWTELTIPKQRN